MWMGVTWLFIDEVHGIVATHAALLSYFYLVKPTNLIFIDIFWVLIFNLIPFAALRDVPQLRAVHPVPVGLRQGEERAQLAQDARHGRAGRARHAGPQRAQVHHRGRRKGPLPGCRSVIVSWSKNSSTRKYTVGAR